MSPVRSRPASRGFVLPVVLVMLVVMTSVVLFNIRRGTVDARLAGNVGSVITTETAASYALRYCELMITVSPPGRTPLAGMPNPPHTIPAPAQGAATPAWRDWINWSVTVLGLPNPLHSTVVLDAATMPGVQRGECLFEDATNELVVLGPTPDVANNAPEAPNTWRKFRITAEVQINGAPGEVRVARAQSELRMSLD